MPTVRILVAHEPLAYRDVLATALRALRPLADIVVVEPTDLDAEIGRQVPHLVFCSRLSDAVQARSLGWVLLYPRGEAVIETSVAGDRMTAGDLVLDEVLSLVDRVASLVPAR